MSDLRTELQSAINREKAVATDIKSVNTAQAKIRDLIATGTGANTDLETLETEHRTAVQSWAANGASGIAPRRDETKFASARARLKVSETDIADADLALRTLGDQFQSLAAELRDIGTDTIHLIQQIELDEANRLLQQLDILEAEWRSIKAQLTGLVMMMQLAMSRTNNPKLIKELENLRNRLSRFPSDPTNGQCQTARLAWQQFEQDLRVDPETTYQHDRNGELP